jgi:predicted RNase H-like HicB family nuclease
MKKFTVVFERDEDGWWAVSVREVRGCRTQAKTIVQGLRRIREALALFVPDAVAAKAELVNVVRLPTPANKVVLAALAKMDKARMVTKTAQRSQEEAATALKAVGVSRRDAAKILGISHQRVQQITK